MLGRRVGSTALRAVRGLSSLPLLQPTGALSASPVVPVRPVHVSALLPSSVLGSSVFARPFVSPLFAPSRSFASPMSQREKADARAEKKRRAAGGGAAAAVVSAAEIAKREDKDANEFDSDFDEFDSDFDEMDFGDDDDHLSPFTSASSASAAAAAASASGGLNGANLPRTQVERVSRQGLSKREHSRQQELSRDAAAAQDMLNMLRSRQARAEAVAKAAEAAADEAEAMVLPPAFDKDDKDKKPVRTWNHIRAEIEMGKLFAPIAPPAGGAEGGGSGKGRDGRDKKEDGRSAMLAKFFLDDAIYKGLSKAARLSAHGHGHGHGHGQRAESSDGGDMAPPPPGPYPPRPAKTDYPSPLSPSSSSSRAAPQDDFMVRVIDRDDLFCSPGPVPLSSALAWARARKVNLLMPPCQLQQEARPGKQAKVVDDGIPVVFSLPLARLRGELAARDKANSRAAQQSKDINISDKSSSADVRRRALQALGFLLGGAQVKVSVALPKRVAAALAAAAAGVKKRTLQDIPTGPGGDNEGDEGDDAGADDETAAAGGGGKKKKGGDDKKKGGKLSKKELLAKKAADAAAAAATPTSTTPHSEEAGAGHSHYNALADVVALATAAAEVLAQRRLDVRTKHAAAHAARSQYLAAIDSATAAAEVAAAAETPEAVAAAADAAAAAAAAKTAAVQRAAVALAAGVAAKPREVVKGRRGGVEVVWEELEDEEDCLDRLVNPLPAYASASATASSAGPSKGGSKYDDDDGSNGAPSSTVLASSGGVASSPAFIAAAAATATSPGVVSDDARREIKDKNPFFSDSGLANALRTGSLVLIPSSVKKMQTDGAALAARWAEAVGILRAVAEEDEEAVRTTVKGKEQHENKKKHDDA